MRKALLQAALVLITLVLTARAGDTPAPPIITLLPGTDKPGITQCPDGAAYVYKVYMIYVQQNAEFPGQGIDIYKPHSTPRNPCGADKGGKYIAIPAGESGGPRFFAGISGNYLFIDQGTGPSYRTLTVFDIRDKTFPLTSIRYSDAKIAGGKLTYYETLNEVSGALDKLPCPQAGKWKQKGLSVIYEERMSFNLATGKVTSLHEFRCSAVQ
jgi:hypothetical protein